MRSERVDVSTRLARWAGLRAGKASAADISPVVVADDLRDGPWAPFVRWQAYVQVTLVAAQFSYIGIQNIAPLSRRTALIVDRIDYRFSAAADLQVHVIGNTPAAPAFSSQGNPWLTNMVEEAQVSALGAKGPFKDAATYNANSATDMSAGAQAPIFPFNDALGHSVQGPWIAGPQGMVILQSSIVNVSLFAAMSGRYYGDL